MLRNFRHNFSSHPALHPKEYQLAFAPSREVSRNIVFHVAIECDSSSILLCDMLQFVCRCPAATITAKKPQYTFWIFAWALVACPSRCLDQDEFARLGLGSTTATLKDMRYGRRGTSTLRVLSVKAFLDFLKQGLGDSYGRGCAYDLNSKIPYAEDAFRWCWAQLMGGDISDDEIEKVKGWRDAAQRGRQVSDVME
jgi:hypothetical protein